MPGTNGAALLRNEAPRLHLFRTVQRAGRLAAVIRAAPAYASDAGGFDEGSVYVPLGPQFPRSRMRGVLSSAVDTILRARPVAAVSVLDIGRCVAMADQYALGRSSAPGREQKRAPSSAKQSAIGAAGEVSSIFPAEYTNCSIAHSICPCTTRSWLGTPARAFAGRSSAAECPQATVCNQSVLWF